MELKESLETTRLKGIMGLQRRMADTVIRVRSARMKSRFRIGVRGAEVREVEVHVDVSFRWNTLSLVNLVENLYIFSIRLISSKNKLK